MPIRIRVSSSAGGSSFCRLCRSIGCSDAPPFLPFLSEKPTNSRAGSCTADPRLCFSPFESSIATSYSYCTQDQLASYSKRYNQLDKKRAYIFLAAQIAYLHSELQSSQRAGHLCFRKQIPFILWKMTRPVQCQKRLLKSGRYRVITCELAEPFRLSDLNSSTDCLLLDIRLPVSGGIELQGTDVCPRNSNPEIFMTGQDRAGTEERAMRRGGSACLRKNFKKKGRELELTEGYILKGSARHITGLGCRDGTTHAPGDEITKDAGNNSVKGWTK